MKILKTLKLVTCGAAIILPVISYGQEVRNLPLGALPMQFNSSFAGEADAVRLNTAFAYDLGQGEDNWVDQAFGYHASYDQFVPAIRSGIGVAVHRETSRMSYPYRSPDGMLGTHELEFRSNRISVAIAPKFSIKGKYTISPSIDLSYGRGKTSANFASQLGPGPHAINYPPGRHEWLESRLGLLFNSSKYYLGYSVYLLNRHYYNKENSGLFDDVYASYIQAGYTFQRRPDSKFSFTPQIAYRIGGFKEMSARGYFPNEGAINFTFKYDRYLTGFNNVGFHVGWQNEKLRIMATTNPFAYEGLRSFGVGNLSVRYVFKE